jgi:hypothetical protein
MLPVLRPTPEVRPAEPTPTLRLLAGDYATRVAALWPAPHGAYLEMPAQRRHLVHLVLDFAPRVEADALRFARADVVARDRLGTLPPGFVRLLGRLGEIAWAAGDYLMLVSLFEHEGAAVVLRQRPIVTPQAVQALHALAPPLRSVAIFRHIGDPAQALLLEVAWRCVMEVRGPVAAALAAERWARAISPERLFAMAAEDIGPDSFDLAPAPVHADLRRLGGPSALHDAGRRFRNCLAVYRDRAAEGQIALYEWAGPPPAALSLARDGVYGWRLEEARGVENVVLDDAARAALTATLRTLGVHVGRPGRDLEARLQRAAGLAHVWIDENETELAAFGL